APGYTPMEWRSLEGALFVQDVIKVTRNLEIRVGFRGEFTNGWNEAQGFASNYLYGPDGVIQTQPSIGTSALSKNHAEFLPEPRVGLAWSPFGGRSKTVIRVAYGRYHSLL